MPAVPLGWTEERLLFGDCVACGGDGFGAVVALASRLPGTRKPKKRGPFQAVPSQRKAERLEERVKESASEQYEQPAAPKGGSVRETISRTMQQLKGA